MDVSRYQPHSDAEYNRIEEVEEEYYEEDFESDIMDDVGEYGQEYPDDADYIENDEEGDCVSQECIVEGAETIDMMSPDIANDDPVNDEVNATLLEDDDSVTVRSDMNDMDSERDDAPNAIDAKASPADGSGDSNVSATLSTALGGCDLTGSYPSVNGTCRRCGSLKYQPPLCTISPVSSFRSPVLCRFKVALPSATMLCASHGLCIVNVILHYRTISRFLCFLYTEHRISRTL